jgi:hypothetical protein
MKEENKLQKPDWFNVKNYRRPSYLDPGYWAYQLEVRQLILNCLNKEKSRVNDLNPKILNWFDSIKRKGILGLDWSYPDLTLTSLGIMDLKTNIERFDNSALNYAEEIRQKQAENDFITNTVSVTTAFELFDTANCMRDSLKNSIMRMKSLTSGIGKEINEDEKENIEIACDFYPTGENFNGLSIIQVDLTAPNELILRDFKKVLDALKNNEESLSKTIKRSKTMKLNDWTNRNFYLLDSGILPYLDLLIYAKLEKKPLIDEDANEYIFGNLKKYVADKVKRSTKKLATEMIHDNQIETLRMLYSSLPPSEWKKKAKNHS